MTDPQLVELYPSSLHIVISLPKWVLKSPGLKNYQKVLSKDFDPATYEIQCGWANNLEEFEWSIYLHRGDGYGIWYHLERREEASIKENAHVPNQSCNVIRTLVTDQSPRTTTGVVCMINMLQLPGENFIVSSNGNQQAVTGGAGSLRAFLDNSTRMKAAIFCRSLSWAISVVVTCFQHVNQMTTAAPSPITPSFDLSGYLRETVGFAYNNVSSAYQLPRPVLVSKFGISLSHYHLSHREQGRSGQLSRIAEEGDFFYTEDGGEVQADEVTRHQSRNRARIITNEFLQRETAEAYRLLQEVRSEDMERRASMELAEQIARQAMTRIEAEEAVTRQTARDDVFGPIHPRFGFVADQSGTTAEMGAGLTVANHDPPRSSNFPVVGARIDTRAMTNQYAPRAINRDLNTEADQAWLVARLDFLAASRANNQPSGMVSTESTTIHHYAANRAAQSADRQAPPAAAYRQQYYTPQQAANYEAQQPELASLFYDPEEEAHYEAQLASEAAVLLAARRQASGAAGWT
jgi:hypothetical protein